MSKLFMSMIFTALWCTTAFGAELKTLRHPLCGVELYFTKVDQKCGAGLYFEKRSPSCEVEAYSERSDIACGTEMKNIEICARPPRCPTCEIRCRYELREVRKTCRLPQFGVESYKSCRHASHGIEAYASCRLPEFGIERYKECAFYKTPEELEAYITEVSLSLENYTQILPMRQADLYSKIRDEASFKCLIEKYDGQDFMEEVVIDLKDKFFLMFGYKYDESEVDCTQTEIDTNPEIRAGELTCAGYTYDTLRTLAQPDGMSKGLFDNFVKKCQAKIVYDNIANWFTTKKEEVSLFQDDLAAKNDASLKNRLLELKSRLEKVSN
ncbi:hypothetical protein [Oligoflexus tunisiensis]|uniref:hypothetical protein n=1 Tax=Oligoflexus tunisiensis TaxID=708132 RepID=UPI00114D3AA8|nr:hypothetical protein [Oligoflexus tunisiensis]